MTAKFATGEDRQAWLKDRRLGIGGSDAPAILGLDKWNTALSIYLEKINNQPPEDRSIESAYFGHLLEPLVAAEFQKRSGLEVFEPADIVEMHNQDYPWMRASIDRYVLQPDGSVQTFLECKTRSSFVSRQWELGPTEDVLAQLQHTMIVTGYRYCWVAVLLGGQAFRYFRVEWDDVLAAMLIDAEWEFWRRVQDRHPPPETAADVASTSSKQGTERGVKSLRVSLEGYRSEIETYRALQWERNYTEKTMASIQATLQLALGPIGRGLLDNRIAVSWLEQPKRELDLEALRREHPDIVERYFVSRPERVFVVKAGKE